MPLDASQLLGYTAAIVLSLCVLPPCAQRS